MGVLGKSAQRHQFWKEVYGDWYKPNLGAVKFESSASDGEDEVEETSESSSKSKVEPMKPTIVTP